MSIYSQKLKQLWFAMQDRNKLTKSERTFLHDAYWNSETIRSQRDKSYEISNIIELLSKHAKPEDLPILMDASDLSGSWANRCDIAEALAQLPKEGPPFLRIMLERETHYCAKFWIARNLVDLDDPIMHPFLDGRIPPNTSPFRRSLWIYGNFENGTLSKEQALGYMTILLRDHKRRETWLRDHILGSDSTEN